MTELSLEQRIANMEAHRPENWTPDSNLPSAGAGLSSVWARNAMICSWAGCEVKLIEPGDKCRRVTTKNSRTSRYFTRTYHLQCECNQQSDWLDKHPQKERAPSTGAGRKQMYTKEQAKIRRTLATRKAELKREYLQAMALYSVEDSISSIGLSRSKWLEILDSKKEKLNQEYITRGGGPVIWWTNYELTLASRK